jgi:gamma-glutamyltranspeptidase/glutathione hydrolase
MPLRDLAAPAVRGARAGWPLERFQTHVIGVAIPVATASREARALWLGGGDKPPAPGTPLANPALADVIETFAAEGPRFVTEGEPAQALIALCTQGGHLTAEDLRRYRPEWRMPHETRRGAARIALNPAPATGGLLADLILSLLPDRADPPTLARVLGLADRARTDAGGPAGLLDPARRAMLAAVLARPQAPRGTTHLSAVDAAGLGAALSLSNGEGCGLVLPGMGIMPNNMLGEADLVPEPGGFAADVRLSSMMSPAAVQWPDGRVAMLGSGGSTRIPGAVAQVIAGLADHGLHPETAVAAPRLHVHDGMLDHEPLREDVAAALRRVWPEARAWDAPSMYFGGVHVVAREAAGGAAAAADPRRDGVAIAG